MHQTEVIRKVLIVGGGTAGWLTACHLAKHLQPRSPGGVQITLLESPDIPTIGVGEGTVPAIRRSLQYLGISETEFIRRCDATFKQSIKFVDWTHNPGPVADYYHHIFDYPEQPGLDLTPYWLQRSDQSRFTDWVSVQGHLCDAFKAPKTMTHAEYDGLANYAYHLDAAKFAALLTEHATQKLGVQHQRATVTAVPLRSDGAIAGVQTDLLGVLDADLYVDCTGFASLLLGQALQVPFIPKSEILFADSALAVQVPYQTPEQEIPPYTIATAQPAGWIWDIGLTTRRGTGYVYSSQHCSHDEAEQAFRRYLGKGTEALPLRRIPMQVGYRAEVWHKNCVAIGLSQGFVEPLEATGLLVFDATARMLAEQFPLTQSAVAGAARRFNQKVRQSWDKVIDFIKLHYLLSQRTDSAFWLDNRMAESIPASLADNLAYWQHQLPSHYDFSSRFEIFNLDNYQYVLYGMEFKPEMAALTERHQQHEQAAAALHWMQQRQQQALATLPGHRALLNNIKKYGLQRV